jgi:hypothetical protein
VLLVAVLLQAAVLLVVLVAVTHLLNCHNHFQHIIYLSLVVAVAVVEHQL